MLSELNNPRVRDLAWCLESPSLLAHGDLPEHVSAPKQSRWLIDALSTHLRELEEDPTELDEFLQRSPTRRVGRYFEQLIEYALSHADCHLLATNHQLHHGKRVIGELDYVFEHASELYHWETALKFYLAHEEGKTLMDFIGPNAADTLGLKVNRILEHQLPMGQHPAVTAIPQLGDRRMHSRAYVRGYLFYRQPNISSSRVPSPIAHEHLRGWWRYCGESLPQSAPEGRWLRVEKPYWLAPNLLAEADDHALLDEETMKSSIAAHFSDGHHPVLLAEMKKEGGYWHEIARGFVVKPQWPNLPSRPQKHSSSAA